MEARPRKLRIFENDHGAPFPEWMDTLERKVHAIVLVRLERIEDGNLGDCKFEGDGVFELRIDFGAGWRVYFGQTGDVVILLGGGMKRTQQRDLPVMKDRWKEHNAKRN